MWDVLTNAQRYVPKNKGEWVLDLGAHFGMFSLYCAARGCNVMALEPCEETYMELLHTADVAKEIGEGNISPMNFGVWDQSGIFPLFQDSETSGSHSMVRESKWVQNIKTMTLDDALSFHSAWDCVKMDIEGAEYIALTQAKNLERIHYLTVEIHNDILNRIQTAEIRELLNQEFYRVDRLPVKLHPEQTVAYFCSRE